MLKSALLALSLAVPAISLPTTSVHAADCTTTTAKDDITTEEALKLYDCIKEELVAGYQKGDIAEAKEYRSWKGVSTAPVSAPTHGGRFVMTFANDTGYADYVKFADDGSVTLPVGSKIAKESFNLSKKGKVKKGPLFLMTKLAAGEADEYGNWLYAAVQPSGKPLKISQKFCHDCHGAYEDQDSLGYPEEEVRVGAE